MQKNDEKEIFRANNVRLGGKTIERDAVRGIIINRQELLMIRSGRNGDYKFPGGGIQGTETHQQALAREIREECGTTIHRFGRLFQKVTEYGFPMEAEYDVFKMNSYYYLCQVDDSRFAQQLDYYEQELEFQPVWVGFEIALRNNKNLSTAYDERKIPWLRREIYMLEQVQEKLFNRKELTASGDQHGTDL